MKMVNRLCVTIVVCFLSFGGFAIATRLGAGVPPQSVTYGSQAPAKDEVVFGD